MRALVHSLAILPVLAATALAGDTLRNPSFEDGLDGWSEMVGATTGGGGVRPEIAIDDAVAHDGERSLRVTGTSDAVIWPLLYQTVDVTAGERVSLRVWARCQGVTKSGGQYGNSNGVLMFADAAGNRVGFLTTAVLGGDREWVELGVDTLAPAGATRAKVGVFHSMSGTAWFDDVRVTVASTDAADEAARAAAFAALETHLRRTWPFWGLPGKPDADELFAEHRPKVLAAEDLAGVVGAVQTMLAQLDDAHIWLDTPLGRLGTVPPASGARFSVHAVLARLDEKVVHGRNVLSGWIGEGDDRVGYVLVATFAKQDPEWNLVQEALDGLSGARALVIDVRPNGGGDETRAQAIAGRFTDVPVEYARQRWRDPTIAGLQGFGPVTTRVLEPAAAEKRFEGRVAVLAGPGCVSSTEGFLLMCKALPDVTVVGRPSRGASGNPGAFVVVPKLTVWSSRWQALDLEDRCIEGAGVPPDVVVEPADPEAADRADPVLDRALELLRE